MDDRLQTFGVVGGQLVFFLLLCCSSVSGEAEVVAGHSSNSDCALLATEGVVSRSSCSLSGTLSTSSGQVGSAVSASCLEVPPNLPVL